MPSQSWIRGMSLEESQIIQPSDVQSHLQQTTQTHNAVSVAISGNSIQSNWIDCDGFDKIAITLLNDGSFVCSADVYWSNDGTNIHGIDGNVISSGAKNYGDGITDTKARYAKVRINNGETAAAHTMSAWAMLKA